MQDCLSKYFVAETVGGDEAIRCPEYNCIVAQPTTKRLGLSRLPRFLLIILKRFEVRVVPYLDSETGKLKKRLQSSGNVSLE